MALCPALRVSGIVVDELDEDVSFEAVVSEVVDLADNIVETLLDQIRSDDTDDTELDLKAQHSFFGLEL